MHPLHRALLLSIVLLPLLAACFSYSEVPARQPQPVVVNPAPGPSGTVVVPSSSGYGPTVVTPGS